MGARKRHHAGVRNGFHEENPAYIQNNGVNAGKASEYFGIGGSDRQAEIVLDGGVLQDEWSEKTGHVLMTGPAAFVFNGEYDG